MKSRKLLLGLALVALGFTSCKDDNQARSEKVVESYSTYVDSLGNIPEEDARTNWSSINSTYQTRTSEAEAALVNIKDKERAQERLNASRAKYDAMNTKMEADMNTKQTATNTITENEMSRQPSSSGGSMAASSQQKLRNSLFGEGKMGNDMSFNWVDKNNIHSVYQTFIHTVENNKDKYSREDWDEVKVMYEALDNRKNTVEKEGLSADDNRKIAALKVKFAPMYTVNRMGAKSAETREAKNK